MTEQTTIPSQPDKSSAAVRSVNVIDGKHEPHRIYHVITEDNKSLEQTARKLAEASAMSSNWELWHGNFSATLKRLRAWCQKRADQLVEGLVDIRSNKVLAYFVSADDRYDLELGNAVTDLEVEIAGSAGIGYFEVLIVPARSLSRFAGPESQIFWQRENQPAADSTAAVAG